MVKVASVLPAAQVTVVVATLDGAAFVAEQIKSICEQTLAPAMVIVTDDGSSDDTLDIVQSELEQRGTPFAITRNPGDRGFGENFCHGLSLVESEFVAFCDQDDVWEPHKLETCIRSMRRLGADVCAHGARLIDPNGHDLGRFRRVPSRSRVYQPNTLPAWFTFFGFSIVARTDLLHQADANLRGKDFWRPGERLAHDAWVTLVGSCLGRVFFTREELVRYRQHGRNLVGARQESLLQRVKLAMGPAADGGLNRALIARRWAAQMKRVAATATWNDNSSMPFQAAERWKRISASEVFRLRMYSADSYCSRIHLMAKALLTGVYASGPGALGARYLPKDILLGVFRLRAAPTFRR